MELHVGAIAGNVAILVDLHHALGDAVQLHSGLEPREPVERILANQENIPHDVAQIIRLEAHDIRIVWIRQRSAGDGNVNRVLRNSGGILQAMTEVRVAKEHAGVAQPSVDVAGNSELMVAEQIAEYECRPTGEHATVTRRVANRRISDVVRVERDVIRMLLEAGSVGQSV